LVLILDGLFHRLPNTIKPLTKECYALHIYQGPYYECSKNRRLGTIELPYREIWDLSYCINEDTCSVLLENKEILKVNMSTCNMEYEKEADGRWYETQTPKLEYIEYIREHKIYLIRPSNQIFDRTLGTRISNVFKINGKV